MLRLLRLRRFRSLFLLRGLTVWAAIRLAAAFLQITHPGLLGAAWILAMVGLAAYLDARRRGEDLFLANLGVPGWAPAAMALPLPILLESVLR
jgi:hypothetical protein